MIRSLDLDLDRIDELSFFIGRSFNGSAVCVAVEFRLFFFDYSFISFDAFSSNSFDSIVTARRRADFYGPIVFFDFRVSACVI